MTVHADDRDLDVLLLERYCSGAASPEERARLDVWFQAHPEQSRWYEQLRAGLQKGAFPDVSAEQSRRVKSGIIREALQRRPGLNGATESRQIGGRGQGSVFLGSWGRGVFKAHPLRRGMWYALATIVVGVLGIAVSWNGQAHHFDSHPPLSVATYTTTNGQRATIKLLDGTTVSLNVASRLAVPADFAIGNHTVYLTGEALFTVSHRDRNPFIVVSGPTTTRVLGTSFMVRHYADDTTATIAVRSGKVVVRSSIVTAGQELLVNRGGGATLGVADPALFSFASGVLVLDKVPLPRAIHELDRWYNADVRLGDATLETRMMSGNIPAGSLTDLMALLELTYDVRVVRDGRVVTLFPR